MLTCCEHHNAFTSIVSCYFYTLSFFSKKAHTEEAMDIPEG